jgi:RNA polymerase sigma factor (sigma-70 family)
VARNVGIPKTHIIWKTIKKIESLRTELVEMNIPLAINRASIFWRRAKRSRTHLSFMDLIQMAVEGLLTCVDKFTPPYTEVWRSVAIGNMVGNFIEANSATILHLFPGDRKTLYRANKYISKNSANLNFEAMVEFINEQPENQKTPVTKKVRKEEVAKLLLATSIVSLDTKAPGDEQTTTAVKGISRMTASDDVRPDVAVEKAETSIALKTAVKSLTPYERKVLKLFYGGYFE